MASSCTPLEFSDPIGDFRFRKSGAPRRESLATPTAIRRDTALIITMATMAAVLGLRLKLDPAILTTQRLPPVNKNRMLLKRVSLIYLRESTEIIFSLRLNDIIDNYCNT